jgi:plasmid replication initiation protein
LDLVEQRLILLAIIEARETGKGINANDALEVHASSYINHFNVEKHTAYTVLKQAADDLFERRFSYQFTNTNGNNEYVKSRWVSEIRYVENEALIKLIFAPSVVPLITRLEQHFTSYELKQVRQLSSRYAIRLYELLIAWRSTGKTPIFELTEFRNQLGIADDEYKRME